MKYKISIDTSLCIGCGLCEENMPEIFRINGYHAYVKKSILEHADILGNDTLFRTEEDCPTEAIVIEKLE